MSVVSKKVGGVLNAQSPCELPRNERQVTYMKQKSKMSGASSSSASDPMSDQIFAIMQSAKVEDHQGKFVRDTRPSPEPAFVIARDRQLDDLVRFCTIPDDFTNLLSIPPLTWEILTSFLHPIDTVSLRLFARAALLSSLDPH